MSTQDPNIPPLDTATEEARGLSLLRVVEKKRDERATNLFLDIPTWDGSLVCEYKVIPKKELALMGEHQARIMKSGNGDNDGMSGDIELIIRASVGLYVIDPKNGDRVKIEDEFGHVGYGRIADVLGRSDITSNDMAVRYLMGTKKEDGTWDENYVAITTHAQAIGRWMRDPSKRSIDLEELLGEL